MRLSYSVRPVHFCSLLRAENVESFMGEIRSVYFVFKRRASKTIIKLAKVSLGRLRKLLGQRRALQRRHAALKPEVDEVIEIMDEDENAVVYGNP